MVFSQHFTPSSGLLGTFRSASVSFLLLLLLLALLAYLPWNIATSTPFRTLRIPSQVDGIHICILKLNLKNLKSDLKASLVFNKDQMAPFKGQLLAPVSTTGHSFLTLTIYLLLEF